MAESISEVVARRKRQLVIDRYAQSVRDIYEREGKNGQRS